MIRRWWKPVGGRICEEYPLVDNRVGVQARRRVDAIVRLDQPTEWVADWRDFGDVTTSDVVVVQAKASGLGLPLMGQAFFSADLARRYLGAASARPVLLCSAGDDDLAPLVSDHAIAIEVQPGTGSSRPFAPGPQRELIAAYHRGTGGTLKYDVPLVPRRPAVHRAHALVLCDGGGWNSGTLRGRDVVLVTTRKVGRLGMGALGQAMFGAELLRRHYEPRDVRTVVVAHRHDAAMGDLADRWGIEVCIIAERDAAP